MGDNRMRDFRNMLKELLRVAYLESDRMGFVAGTDPEKIKASVRLEVIKEIGVLAGLHRIKRQHCFCGSTLEFGDTSLYCSNACKQRAYRIRNGQPRR